MRDLYHKASPKFLLSSENLLKFLKPLYCHRNEGKNWDDTFTAKLYIQLPISGYLSYFQHIIHQELSKIIRMYISETICAINPYFLHESNISESFPKCCSHICDKVTFALVQISSTKDGLKLFQAEYLSPIHLFQPTCIFLTISSNNSPTMLVFSYPPRHLCTF